MTTRLCRLAAAAAFATAATLGAAALRADDSITGQNSFTITKLVSDLPGAAFTDPNLKNPWGVAFSPAGSPFWVSDNATGLSTLYDGDGSIQSLVVTVPGASGQGAPTGIVWNPSSSFLVPKTTTPAVFIFAGEDGTISVWGGGNSAKIAADNSQSGAVYKGLAFGVNPNGDFLYATNFNSGKIDVFDHNYQPATTPGGFQDPNLPAGYAPFGIENISGDLFVSYAVQNAEKHDDVPGQGHGIINVFDTSGNLLRRFASHGVLNSPWGMMRAGYNSGALSGLILIGNFGDGKINAYSTNGVFVSRMLGTNNRPLTIDGLWKLTPGGGAKSSPDTIYFTAGLNGETDGLFGTITPASGDMAGN